MRRHLILFVAAAGLTGLLTLAPAQETLAVTYGWNNNNGNYTYIEENGSVHKGWIHTTDGWYYLYDRFILLTDIIIWIFLLV